MQFHYEVECLGAQDVTLTAHLGTDHPDLAGHGIHRSLIAVN